MYIDFYNLLYYIIIIKCITEIKSLYNNNFEI